jgi:2-methylcitrate dehydratase PrpD
MDMRNDLLASVCAFVGNTHKRAVPPEIYDLAKKCLIDWFSVSIAALPDAAPTLVRQQMQQWATHGSAMNLYGDRGTPAAVALVNGTLSHSLDYDDMHFGSAFHASGPTLAAALAVAMQRESSELALLNSFLTGYELGTAMGDAGLGPSLAAVGWHPTGILGHFSATCSVAALLQLNPAQIANALGLAATQAAGLQASGGTMAKPFHVGKAAMNGVMAAELASLGMDAYQNIFHDSDGMLGRLFQKPMGISLEGLGQRWNLLDNTFKPYAACQLTHAPHEAARGMHGSFSEKGLREVRVHVNPLAKKVAGRESASTPMEGKFSIAYCVALGLRGYSADMTGFTQARIDDTSVSELAKITQVMTSEGVERWASHIELIYDDGPIVHGETKGVRGSPLVPLSWADIDEKFLSSTSDLLGVNANELLQILHNFERPGSLKTVSQILETCAQRRR